MSSVQMVEIVCYNNLQPLKCLTKEFYHVIKQVWTFKADILHFHTMIAFKINTTPYLSISPQYYMY
jgi:hypothetical protein